MKVRWPLLVAAAAFTLAPLASLAVAESANGAVACASGEACVLVTVEGSSPTTQTAVPYADVAAGGINALYRFRAPAGDATTSDQLTGESLSDIVEAASVPVGSVSFVEVSARAGRIMTVAAADLADPSPFPDGTVPAVYLAGSNSLGYITPIRSDDLPNDYDTGTFGSAITVTVHTTGRLLDPKISVDDDTVDTGTPVEFSASFASDPGTAIDYSWSFGDGSTATGSATRTHPYSGAGTYQAIVTARGADGSLGIAKSTLVTVGKAAPPTNATGGGSGATTATPAPTVGPTTSASGAATPRATPRATATAKPTAKLTARATAAPTSLPTAPATSRPTSTARATATLAPTPSPGATGTPVPREGASVSGILISGSPNSSNDGSAAPATAAAAGRAGSRAALGWGSAAVAGTVVLLGAGAFLESGLLAAALAHLKRRIR